MPQGCSNSSAIGVSENVWGAASEAVFSGASAAASEDKFEASLQDAKTIRSVLAASVSNRVMLRS